MAVKVIGFIRHDGKVYEPGDVINEIEEKEQARLIELGVASAIEEETEEKPVSLSKMKVDELRDLAEEKGIEEYEDMKKQELIDALNEE